MTRPSSAPWVLDTADWPLCIGVAEGDDMRVIATIHNPGGPHLQAEALANARLMTAAPHLADAALLVIQRWERGDLADAVRHLEAALRNAGAIE